MIAYIIVFKPFFVSCCLGFLLHMVCMFTVTSKSFCAVYSIV